MDKKHIGSDLDDFLRDEGILDEAEAIATKRVIAYQIAREMERTNVSQSELARRMKTSRSAVERLLDPTNPSVTLVTLERAASAVGKRLKVLWQGTGERRASADAQDRYAVHGSHYPLDEYVVSDISSGR